MFMWEMQYGLNRFRLHCKKIVTSDCLLCRPPRFSSLNRLSLIYLNSSGVILRQSISVSFSLSRASRSSPVACCSIFQAHQDVWPLPNLLLRRDLRQPSCCHQWQQELCPEVGGCRRRHDRLRQAPVSGKMVSSGRHRGRQGCSFQSQDIWTCWWPFYHSLPRKCIRCCIPCCSKICRVQF